jgi:hypothetical protein
MDAVRRSVGSHRSSPLLQLSAERRWNKSLATTQRYIREAEVSGRDFGEPFPALPAEDLIKSLASLETVEEVSGSNATGSCNAPSRFTRGGGRGASPFL